MAGLTAGAAEFAALARRLKDAGETGLQRELYRAIDDAAQPLVREIGSVAHLMPYMPDRYAGVLAGDLSVTTLKLTGQKRAGVRIVAKGRAHRRRVVTLDDGIIMHPVFRVRTRAARWVSQTDGMKAGFFHDPARRSAPRVRDAILAAMHDVATKITKG